MRALRSARHGVGNRTSRPACSRSWSVVDSSPATTRCRQDPLPWCACEQRRSPPSRGVKATFGESATRTSLGSSVLSLHCRVSWASPPCSSVRWDRGAHPSSEPDGFPGVSRSDMTVRVHACDVQLDLARCRAGRAAFRHHRPPVFSTRHFLPSCSMRAVGPSPSRLEVSRQARLHSCVVEPCPAAGDRSPHGRGHGCTTSAGGKRHRAAAGHGGGCSWATRPMASRAWWPSSTAVRASRPSMTDARMTDARMTDARMTDARMTDARIRKGGLRVAEGSCS